MTFTNQPRIIHTDTNDNQPRTTMTNYDRWLQEPYQDNEARLDFEEAMANHEWQRCYTDCIDADDYTQHPAIEAEYSKYFDSTIGQGSILTFDDWITDQDPADIIRWVGEHYTNNNNKESI